jgi:cation transport ATPase
MIIVSENKQTKYKFGFVGRLMYWVEYIFASSAEEIAAYGSNERTMVRARTLSREASLNKIKETLQSLKVNGYEITTAETELQKIITTGPSKKLQAGTSHWRKDKALLFIIILSLFTIAMVWAYFQGAFSDGDGFIMVPIFIFAIIFLFGLMTIFARIKNFLFIILSILLGLMILLFIFN